MQESFQSPRGNCVILPPPMTEGRVLSRRSGAAGYRVHLAKAATERLLLCVNLLVLSYVCMTEMLIVSIISFWIKMLYFSWIEKHNFLHTMDDTFSKKFLIEQHYLYY